MLATKLFQPMHDGPRRRRAVPQGDPRAGRRLAGAGSAPTTSTCYQIHRFDPDVPVEETMEALHDVVKAGKVRYLGASSMWAWQFAKHAARRRPRRLDEVRLHAGPVQPAPARGGARDVRPARRSGRRARIPWSPLAAGRSPGRGARRAPSALGDRPDVDMYGRPLCLDDRPGDRRRRANGSPRSAACRWPPSRWPGCCATRSSTAPIVGATKPHHLADAVAALDLELTDEEIDALEEHYTPREPTYFN